MKKDNIMRIPADHWLKNRPIAHRGLWGGDIIENSLPAYEKAAREGFPIEIDVFLTKDNVFVSFHDDYLTRMTGKEGRIADYTLEEIKSFPLLGTDNRIPTLKEVLDVCRGKIPILIEIKNQTQKDVVERLLEELKDYDGEFAIQSFNPLYINKVKKLRPDIIRGVLGTNKKAVLDDLSMLNGFVVKNLALDFLVKPDFISYEFIGYPEILKKTKGKIALAWTITSPDIYEKIKSYADNVIFEHFLP